MTESALEEEFDEWFKKLKPLPESHYEKTRQTAKELAEGIPRGFWVANVRQSGDTSKPADQRKHRYWQERVVKSNTSLAAMYASLQAAGFVQGSGSSLDITSAAFDLLRKPTRLERIDRWQTGIEIALVIIFFAHFLVLLPPAIESAKTLGLCPS